MKFKKCHEKNMFMPRGMYDRMTSTTTLIMNNFFDVLYCGRIEIRGSFLAMSNSNRQI